MNFKLTQFQKYDGPALHAALKAPGVVKHMATAPFSLDDCQWIVEDTIEHWEKHKYGSWAVYTNDKLVGWAGFKFWQENEVELLIVLGQNHWGLGLEIHNHLLQIARKNYDLHELYILLPFTRKTYNTVIKRLGYSFCENLSFEGQDFKKFKLCLKKPVT